MMLAINSCDSDTPSVTLYCGPDPPSILLIRHDVPEESNTFVLDFDSAVQFGGDNESILPTHSLPSFSQLPRVSPRNSPIHGSIFMHLSRFVDRGTTAWHFHNVSAMQNPHVAPAGQEISPATSSSDPAEILVAQNFPGRSSLWAFVRREVTQSKILSLSFFIL